jgi:hypothetical protein
MDDPPSYVPEAPPAQKPATDLPDHVGTENIENRKEKYNMTTSQSPKTKSKRRWKSLILK